MTINHKLFWIMACLCVGAMVSACSDARSAEQQKMGALATLTLIHQGQDHYLEHYGRFASTLGELGPAKGDTRGPAAPGFIPESLSRLGERLGYKFTLTRTPNGFRVVAMPVHFERTGEWTFLSEATFDKFRAGLMSVRAHHGREPASLTDPESTFGFRLNVEPDQEVRERRFPPGSR